MKKAFAIALCLVVVTAFLGGCGKQEPPPAPSSSEEARFPKTVKASFIYPGEVAKSNFALSQDQARQLMEQETGIETQYAENVSADACENIIRGQIADGCNAIFATDAVYADTVARLAAAFPKVFFFQFEGEKTADNLTSYGGRLEEGWFLAGMVAGLTTKNGHIGYLAPVPDAKRQNYIDAFLAGIQLANAAAQVSAVTVSDVWRQGQSEVYLAHELVYKPNTQTLLAAGCDVIATFGDSFYPAVEAQAKGAKAIGCHVPGDINAPDAYLTAAIWRWSGYYTRQILSLMDGTFVPERFEGGLAEEVVGLDVLTENCAPHAATQVEAAASAVISGQLALFTDADGKPRPPMEVEMLPEAEPGTENAPTPA